MIGLQMARGAIGLPPIADGSPRYPAYLPRVHFVDLPGSLIGAEPERTGTIRRCARVGGGVPDIESTCAILVRNGLGVAAAEHMSF